MFKCIYVIIRYDPPPAQGSCDKRFGPIGLENNPENRRKYRALMMGAKGLEQYISGVIFHEETLTQKDDDGVLFPEVCGHSTACVEQH